MAGRPLVTDGVLAIGERLVARPGLIPEAGPVEGDPPGELVWALAVPIPKTKVKHARAMVVVRIAVLTSDVGQATHPQGACSLDVTSGWARRGNGRAQLLARSRH